MIKRIILILSIVIFPLATFAEISKDDEDKLTNCTGIYYAYSMIPQGQLELDKIGYRRQVALRCQHFLIAPPIIQSTDLVLMGTRSFAKRNNLPFVEIPIEIPSMEYFLIWHKNDEGDGGHIWMKDLIIRAFKDAQR